MTCLQKKLRAAVTLPSGVSFGESALVNAHHTRSSSVYAGRGGVHLALLHRGSVNTLRFLAETQVGGACIWGACSRYSPVGVQVWSTWLRSARFLRRS